MMSYRKNKEIVTEGASCSHWTEIHQLNSDYEIAMKFQLEESDRMIAQCIHQEQFEAKLFSQFKREQQEKADREFAQKNPTGTNGFHFCSKNSTGTNRSRTCSEDAQRRTNRRRKNYASSERRQTLCDELAIGKRC